MEKVYHIKNLDCANCAAKIETKLHQLPGVENAVISFTAMQLRLTAEDPDSLLPQVLAVAQQVEAHIQFLPKDQSVHHTDCTCEQSQEHLHHGGCSCGHAHPHNHHDHNHHTHHHGHQEHADKKELAQIIIGAGLFLTGLLLQWLLPGIPVHIPVFIAAYLLLGLEILGNACKNLTRGHVFDENFLMSLATLGAFCIGEFPEAVGVMLFYRIGEYFEHRATARSRAQIMEAIDLRPETINLILGNEIHTTRPEEVKVGDLLLVRPGDRIPLDGTVVSGESRIDTAPITGEPVPVAVHPGDKVISGCVNTSGQLTVRVDKLLEESMVTRILNSVEKAAASKPKIDRFITRFARVYTPAVVLTAGAVAILPPLLIDQNWNYWVYTALSFLVMSCPCALVLSVPLAFFSGIGLGSKQGILFKGGLSIEALAGVKAVIMDKTGTITQGNFVVQQVEGGNELLRLCASCEQHSTHPIAVSIVAAAQGLHLAQPETLEEIPGHGIQATVEGKRILCGNGKLMARFGLHTPEVKGTRVWVAVDGTLAGWIQISDTLKPGAAQAVQLLHNQGIATAMLTGDSLEGAQTVAVQTGIQRCFAKLLPEEKLAQLQKLRSELGSVMFVGDGINDAPVLSGADVGAAMGNGADAAIEAADVVFMTSQPQAIPEALRIARLTRKIAWQNVVFALAIKLLVMVMGLLGYASMWAAVFADSGVAMLCVLNSIRILYKK